MSFITLKAIWKEKQSRIEAAERIVKPILSNSIHALADHVDVDGKRIVVYNPDVWERTDRVQLFLGVYMRNFNVNRLKDTQTGELVDVYTDNNLVSFTAKNVPALGYKTYEIIPDTGDRKPVSVNQAENMKNTIENEYFIARIEPGKDFINYTNHYYYYLNSSIALLDNDRSGVAVDTPDAPGISIDSTGLFRFGKHFEPKTSLLYVNLYNTQWGTNFTEWVEGAFHATVRIRSFDQYNPEKSLVTPSEESRTPLFAAYSDKPNGELPICCEGLKLGRKGIYMTALQKNEDDLLLRLWEQAGMGGEVTITLPESFRYKKAILCNLRNVKLENEINITGQKLRLNIDANAPVTILLTAQ